MANAKKKWLIDYQQEREKKREYVKQNVIAQNLDVGNLQKKLLEHKNSIIPSLDDVTMTELENIVSELAHEEQIRIEKELEV